MVKSSFRLTIAFLLFSSALTAEPVGDAVDPLLQEATACEKKRDFECAIEKYGSYLRKNPASFEANAGLGRSHYWISGGAGRKAVPYFERALQIKPDDVYCNFQVGMLSKDPKKKVLHLEKVKNQSPQHRLVYVHLGLALKELGRLDEAVAVLKVPVEKGWQATNEQWRIAEIYEEQGKLEEALALFKEIQPKAPEHMNISLNIGRVLFKLGRYDEALTYLTEGKNSTQSEAELIIGQIYLQTGKNEEAAEKLRSACYAGQKTACTVGKIPPLKAVNGVVSVYDCTFPIPAQIKEIHVRKEENGYPVLSSVSEETNFQRALQTLKLMRVFYQNKTVCGVALKNVEDQTEKDDSSASRIRLSGQSEQKTVTVNLVWDPLFEALGMWIYVEPVTERQDK